MIDILLINPNTTVATTEMMVGIATSVAPDEFNVRGATAARGAPMIVSERQLMASAGEVVEIGRREAARVGGIIVGAFGDPGLDILRREIAIPVVGLCEAAMLEAAVARRRFGVATTTPGLAALINAKPAELGLRRSLHGNSFNAGRSLITDTRFRPPEFSARRGRSKVHRTGRSGSRDHRRRTACSSGLSLGTSLRHTDHRANSSRASLAGRTSEDHRFRWHAGAMKSLNVSAISGGRKR